MLHFNRNTETEGNQPVWQFANGFYPLPLQGLNKII